MSHTKGEWTATAFEVKLGDYTIADCCTQHRPPGMLMAQVEANAQLIAAAPEMYEALEYLVSALTDYLEDVGEGKIPMGLGCIPVERLSQADKLARQALAKVKGRSQ